MPGVRCPDPASTGRAGLPGLPVRVQAAVHRYDRSLDVSLGAFPGVAETVFGGHLAGLVLKDLRAAVQIAAAASWRLAMRAGRRLPGR